jgi:hypothetical protein
MFNATIVNGSERAAKINTELLNRVKMYKIIMKRKQNRVLIIIL